MIDYIFFIALLAGSLWCAWRISVADFRRRIIPDAYLFPLMLAGMLAAAFVPNWVCDARGAAIGAAFGYAIGAITGFAFDYSMRRKNPNAPTPIGMGDIKLLGVGGVWMGPTGLAAALVMACISGAIWARVKKQNFIPFAPFFLGGALLTLLAMSFLL